MVRIVSILIGIGLAFVLLISLISGVKTYFQSPPQELASEVWHKEPKALHLASDGHLRCLGLCRLRAIQQEGGGEDGLGCETGDLGLSVHGVLLVNVIKK